MDALVLDDGAEVVDVGTVELEGGVLDVVVCVVVVVGVGVGVLDGQNRQTMSTVATTRTATRRGGSHRERVVVIMADLLEVGLSRTPSVVLPPGRHPPPVVLALDVRRGQSLGPPATYSTWPETKPASSEVR
jgi:hypothetical protein